jgi:hypothetical protein
MINAIFYFGHYYYTNLDAVFYLISKLLLQVCGISAIAIMSMIGILWFKTKVVYVPSILKEKRWLIGTLLFTIPSSIYGAFRIVSFYIYQWNFDITIIVTESLLVLATIIAVYAFVKNSNSNLLLIGVLHVGVLCISNWGNLFCIPAIIFCSVGTFTNMHNNRLTLLNTKLWILKQVFALTETD